MKNSKFLIALLLLLSCKQIEPRRPINPKPSTTVFSETVNEAKKIRSLEDASIKKQLESDSLTNYKQSEFGFWYAYQNKVEGDTITPKKGDRVRFSYEIRSLNDSLIYNKEELGIVDYIVDEEEQITGIQQGIKMMKAGETITFIFPSYVAFGTSGDGKKIGIYQTIKSTITLININ